MSRAAQYFYQTEVDWTGEKNMKLSSGNLPTIAAGAPPEFKGRGENWSPEHLFVASLNACYALTLLAIAELSKITFASLSSAATGKLEKLQAGGYQITEILIKPRVVIESLSDVSLMPRIIEKAKENCFISHSIKSSVKIEPEIFHRQTPASPCPLGDAPPPSQDSHKS